MAGMFCVPVKLSLPECSGGDGYNPGLTVESCDVSWHGTSVAGVMVAQTNNGIGVAGVAPGAKVVSVRALNACGRGLTSDVADGLVWAAGGSVPGMPDNKNPAKIINLSVVGTGPCTATTQNAINTAVDRGAIVVVAAGNASVDVANAAPANCFNITTVAATTSRAADPDWSYTNYGAGVDIAAPGENIWTTSDFGTSTPGPAGYESMSGTSFATPMVSAVMALVQSVAPNRLSGAEMRTLLAQTAQPFPGNPSHSIGPGILDAQAAVLAAKSGTIPSAAELYCAQKPGNMWVECRDLSTERGAPIAKRVFNWGLGFERSSPFAMDISRVNYEYPGTYNLSLTVTDSTGAVSKVVRPVKVLPVYVERLNPGIAANVTGSHDNNYYYSIDVPDGTKSLNFQLSDGIGDGAMYIRRDTPSTLNALSVCWYAGNRFGPANCKIDSPVAGTYYVAIVLTSDAKAMNLTATYLQ